MSKIDEAMQGIHYMDELANRDGWINGIHPLSKILVTVWYIGVLVSYGKYNVVGILGMILYPIIIAIIGEVPMWESIKRIRVMLLLVTLLGIANPIFDRQVIAHLGGIPITSGCISMVTLLLKGILAVLASYLLIVTTGIENICYGLRLLHMPKMMVTIIVLIYRYLTVLLKEVARMNQSYQLRAPKQKGIKMNAWGPFVGQLLLRTIDRGQIVYESMLLRGYKGEYLYNAKIKMNRGSIIYLLFFIVLIGIIRIVPVFG